MTAISYYIKSRFQHNQMLNEHILKSPAILYPLAFMLSAYFLLFGWRKTNRFD